MNLMRINEFVDIYLKNSHKSPRLVTSNRFLFLISRVATTMNSHSDKYYEGIAIENR